MAYGVVRLDRIKSARDGNVDSVKHTVDMENGFVFHATALASGEREIKSVVVPTAASILTDELLLHGSVPLTYIEGQLKIDFILKAGKPGRGFHMEKGDIVSISDRVIDGTTVVGQYVIPQADSLKLAVATDLTGGTRFAAQIIAKETLYGQPVTVIQVLKA